MADTDKQFTYAIVKFVNEEKEHLIVELIPINWIEENEKLCSYPKKISIDICKKGLRRAKPSKKPGCIYKKLR